MIIYSVTTSLPQAIEEDWKKWMEGHHIPNVMKTGYFNNYKMFKLIYPNNSPNEVTYSMQYEAESLQQYLSYQETDAPKLKKESAEKFGDVFKAVRSVMEEV